MERNSEDCSAPDLRTQAVQRVGTSAASERKRLEPSAEETRRLVHELQVHQIELEMQNEELRRAHEELAASRARYFDLYELAPVGYLTLSGEGVILEANLAAATMLGLTRGALVARPFVGVVHPEERDASRAHFARLVESETPHSWDARMMHTDGSPCWAHLQAVLTQNGECRMTLNDITDRKRAEAALAQADARVRQLQKAESLERMAAAIAHHFNNKLHVVLGSLELAAGDPAGSAKFLGEAMQAAHQAAELSTLMLTFVGQATASLEPLDLSQTCQRFLPLLRAALPAGLPLETDLPLPGPIVRAHADQISQLLMNLVTNAGEAVGKKTGVVRLSVVATVPPEDIPEAHRFPAEWEPKSAVYACLEVADSGRGMAERDVERVFEPFFSDKAAGRGLGLSAVLGIVRAHGGAVAVRSEPGRGSTFRVFLPLSFAKAPPPPAQAEEQRPGGTVLLVEDEDIVRSLTATMLRGLGFSVIGTSSGFDAVAELRKHPAEVRLALCDLSMPGMDGWETLSALRVIVPGVPVILCSGYDRAQAMAGHHRESPQAFLRKPYRMADLSAAIRSALGNHEVRNEMTVVGTSEHPPSRGKESTS